MQHSLFNEKQAAEYLGLSTKTLQMWRWRKLGPRYKKLGKSVRYRAEDLEEFLESGAVETRDSVRAEA